jgi:predicted nucleic acid-binding protein
MNRWLLDTNIVSELSKDQPDPNCLKWLGEHRGQCFISAITVAEIAFGIERLVDGRRKTELAREFAFLLEDYDGRFFDFDGNAGREWGRYAAELEADYGAGWFEQCDLRDTQIAAIAREYELTIATRNTKHFPFCDVVNPFTAS